MKNCHKLEGILIIEGILRAIYNSTKEIKQSNQNRFTKIKIEIKIHSTITKINQLTHSWGSEEQVVEVRHLDKNMEEARHRA